MKVKYIKTGLMWGLGILALWACLAGVPSSAMMLPPGPIGMIKQINFDQKYLVMDGVTYSFDDAILAVIKEKNIAADVKVKIVFTEKDGKKVITTIIREDEIQPKQPRGK